MEFFNYFLFSSLYMAPFFVIERIVSCNAPSSDGPFWWPRMFFLLILQSAVNGLDLHFPVLVHLFQNPLPVVSHLRNLWSETSIVVYWGGAFTILTLFHYWSHVARHRSSFLWRWCHQMHHSSERFESFLSLYIHPGELILLKICFASTLYFAGFGIRTLALLSLIYFFINAWTHMKIRTPRWLGYIIFRPEQHALHHTGAECNFGIIPLWDLIFGTFENPKDFPQSVGFEGSQQKKFWPILFGH